MKPFFDPRSLNASIQVTLSLFTLDPCWANRDHVRLVQIVFPCIIPLIFLRTHCSSVAVKCFRVSLYITTHYLFIVLLLYYTQQYCAMQDRAMIPGMIYPKQSFFSNDVVYLYLIHCFCSFSDKESTLRGTTLHFS